LKGAINPTIQHQHTTTRLSRDIAAVGIIGLGSFEQW